MNCIICDDNKKFAEGLAEKIVKINPDANVKIYTSLAELNFKIEDDGEEIDAVFMDIKQKDGNGIEAWHKIAEKYPQISAVYVTGYGEEFFQEIFMGADAFMPVAFITKPVEEKYLLNALNRIASQNNKQITRIAVKQSNTTIFIIAEELFSVSSNGRKLIYTSENETIEAYGNIKNIMENMPNFLVRCHNSHIVNIRRIKSINNWTTVVMQNDTVFSISRSYRAAFKQAVTRYC